MSMNGDYTMQESEELPTAANDGSVTTANQAHSATTLNHTEHYMSTTSDQIMQDRDEGVSPGNRQTMENTTTSSAHAQRVNNRPPQSTTSPSTSNPL
ncbi:hypothetical protein HDV05_004152, partial [Chytridiales sp. JEL 0842]